MSIVFQVLITDPILEPAVFPPSLSAAIASVKAAFPNSEHRLYNEPALRDFIRNIYGAEILSVFDGLRPYAYKSDLARYCLLHHYGGWYVDIGTKLLGQIGIGDGVDMIAFADRGSYMCKPWAIQNGLLYSRPGNPVFAEAMQMVCRHYHSQYYGGSDLDPTGPNMFGRVVACCSDSLNVTFGKFDHLTPGRHVSSLAFVTPTGFVVGFHKTAWSAGVEGGDISGLGIAGGNNYRAMWASREIYA